MVDYERIGWFTTKGDDFPRALREGKTAMIIEESAVCCTMK